MFQHHLFFFFKVAQSCPTFCDPMDYTVQGILQAGMLEWVTFPFSRESSQLRDRTQVSCTAGRFFTSWATREAPSIILFNPHNNHLTKEFYPHFSDKKTEAQKVCVTSQGPTAGVLAKLAFQRSLPNIFVFWNLPTAENKPDPTEATGLPPSAGRTQSLSVMHHLPSVSGCWNQQRGVWPPSMGRTP